ncbi:carbohydrate ABC transporter permease [Paraburkholderia dipogonis]|jgi:multiple sugar transport system permease protein|uniref:carbohydrate ABC transporter permease n=1 Tax=Paraburkholderia dipogonis TaxID=1211383 RepID=UPI0038BA8AA9
MSDSSIASADPPREARRHSTLKQHERRVGVALALPALAAFVVVILIPFVKSLKLALFRYTIDTPEPQFVGFENFVKLFRDPTIVNVCLNTLLFVASATCVTMVISLAWALMMNQAFKGRALVRAASLLPWVLPSTVTAFLAAWIFNGQYGVLNAILLSTGLITEPITWLAERHGAMACVVITKVWLSVPLFMAFFLAGLQSVSQDQVDAARVDGCQNLGVLRHVVLPHLAPTIIIVMILGTMGNLQAFDVIYALTQGGPVGATTMLSVEVYKQAFENWDMGMACAVGVLWFVLIAVPTVFYLRALFKRES